MDRNLFKFNRFINVVNEVIDKHITFLYLLIFSKLFLNFQTKACHFCEISFFEKKPNLQIETSSLLHFDTVPPNLVL